MTITPVPADDPDARSADPIASNLQALRTLFPLAFAEGKVDFDVLRQLLGDAVEDGDERYGLNWSGKRQARRLALQPSLGTLRPAKADSVDWDTTRNLIIEGDNLEVLKLLQKSYAGKVKLIYIDPPYNTGNDFVYPDDYADSLRNYLRRTGQVHGEGVKNTSNPESSGRYHTDWLNMMYPRLILARGLLSSEGVIAISIDEKECSHLTELCDSILGIENRIGTVVWKNATDNNPTRIALEHEYIVFYARSIEHVGPIWKNKADDAKNTLLAEFDKLKKEGLSLNDIQACIRSFIRANREVLGSVTHYDRVDEDGLYTGSRKVHNPKPGGYKFDVIHPNTEKVCIPPVNGYRYPESTFQDLLKGGKVLFGGDENQIIQIKEYLYDFSSKFSSVIHLDSRAGANGLQKLFTVQKLFTNPKPVELMREIFSYTIGPGDLVLDFFSGSGTTGHAVMAQNAADGGNRHYILVQLPEPLDPDDKNQKTAADFCDKLGKPRNIAELTKERLRRAAAKIRAEAPETKADLGFRAYKLANSNLRRWQPRTDSSEALAEDLVEAADNLLPGRSEDDLLVELLLKRGIDLAEPMQEKMVGNRRYQAFGGGVLVTHFGDISAADAEIAGQTIADWIIAMNPVAPAVVFFRDIGFADDVAKANVEAILKQRLKDRGPGLPDLLEAVRSV